MYKPADVMTALIIMIIKCGKRFCQLFCCLVCCIAVNFAVAQSGDTVSDRTARDLAYWEELAFWKAIENSEKIADIQAYLERYPQGRYAALARVRLKLLQMLQANEGRRLDAENLATDTKSADLTRNRESVQSSVPTLTRPGEYIALKSSNVRAAPTTSASKIAKLEQGQRVQVTGAVADTNWLRIETEDGLMGYVFSELLQPATQ